MTATDLETRPAADPSGTAAGDELGPGGRNEFGAITFADTVVAKIAARAAVEVPDAGGAAPRVLGHALPDAAATLGVRQTSLDALPHASADVDGSMAVVKLQISVRWPASVPKTASAVRARVIERVSALTGLNVTELDIAVLDLDTDLAPPPRVR
jgi:uncharacterized alkaline shock family protein YloU